MQRKPRILIVILSAVITIGTLLATVGKPPFARHHSHFSHCEKTEAPTKEQK